MKRMMEMDVEGHQPRWWWRWVPLDIESVAVPLMAFGVGFVVAYWVFR